VAQVPGALTASRSPPWLCCTHARSPSPPRAMQQNDMDEKVKPQLLSQAQRWAVGGAVLLLGFGAWSLKKPGDVLHPRALTPKYLQGMEAQGPVAGLAQPELSEVADPEAGPESLEDALSTLESGGNWAAQGIRLPDSSVKLPPAEKPKPRKGKAAKAKPARETGEEEEEEGAPKPKADAAGRKTPKRKAPKDNAEVAAALDKLEAGPAGGKSKKQGAGGGDREKAETIIREALEKMQSAPEPEADAGLLGGDLRERLEAMVQDEAERDRDPDIRKAKAIIKDAIKKMDAGRPRKGKAAKTAEPEDEKDPAGDPSHLEFAKRLKEEAAIKGDHEMATVREDFKREFGSDHRRMLCSGCKLVAARLDSELSAHDVHEAESPTHMIASKRKAIDATCHSLRHLHAASGEGGARFVATEAAEGDETDAAPRLGQKLCVALLEEAKFEVLSRLIQRKVPQASLFHAQERASNNWERILCAQRARVCKRNEVREDEEEEEEEL